MAVFAAFAKRDAGAYSDGVRCPTFEFFLGCHAVSGGGHCLKVRRNVFVCYEYCFVAVGEHGQDGVVVGV